MAFGNVKVSNVTTAVNTSSVQIIVMAIITATPGIKLITQPALCSSRLLRWRRSYSGKSKLVIQFQEGGTIRLCCERVGEESIYRQVNVCRLLSPVESTNDLTFYLQEPQTPPSTMSELLPASGALSLYSKSTASPVS